MRLDATPLGLRHRAIFMLNALSATTLPVYLGLGQVFLLMPSRQYQSTEDMYGLDMCMLFVCLWQFLDLRW